jgi:hypothetical protein
MIFKNYEPRNIFNISLSLFLRFHTQHRISYGDESVVIENNGIHSLTIHNSNPSDDIVSIV